MTPAPRRFRPTFWATFFAGLGVALMFGLGVWQIDRLGTKQEMIAERESRPALEALDPEQLLAIGDAAPFEFRRAELTGRFLHDREMLLLARSMNRNVGFQVVTPFVLETGEELLINRGWIPDDREDPATRAEGQLDGQVTIVALVRRPGAPNWLVPDNVPADLTGDDAMGGGDWYWMDLPAMREAAGLAPNGPPLYLEAIATDLPGGFPIGGQTRLELRNDHLQYAVTWFLLGGALAIIWFVFHWRRDEKAGTKAAGPKAS
ncbi:MAG: SURF1 family protein [Rhodospirillaceae bacterium]|nr:SURF1 family protein [Rhodospirillaceae bacterium]